MILHKVFADNELVLVSTDRKEIVKKINELLLLDDQDTIKIT